MLYRISVDPRVCDGKPTTRSQEYPELEKDDVYQAAKYAARKAPGCH